MRVVVVDYGMGNLRSVYQALRAVAPDQDVRISTRADDVLAADRLVLPGQGAMPDCIAQFTASGLRDAVLRVAESRPLFGVCVGEQMLLDRSDESHDDQPTLGLGLIPGHCVRFAPENMMLDDGSRLKVPHMGWNHVSQRSHPMWRGIAQNAMFYFVHSYYAVPEHEAHIAGTTQYGRPGVAPFTCSIARDNIFATQFHPEKSASAGLQLYRNFMTWTP